MNKNILSKHTVGMIAIMLMIITIPGAVADNVTILPDETVRVPVVEQTVCACDPTPQPTVEPTVCACDPTPEPTAKQLEPENMVKSNGTAEPSTTVISGGSTITETVSPTETQSPKVQTQIIAIANASATGNETSAYTHTHINGNVTTASAESIAMAFNGSTATAEAFIQGSFMDMVMATAFAKATVTANIGETIWAHALARITFNGLATASSYSQASVSDTNPLAVNIELPAMRKMPINAPVFGGGFDFGSSMVERYCLYKVQTTLNDSTLNKHAIYNMDIIWQDFGMHSAQEFENKYSLSTENCSAIIIKNYGLKS